MPHKRTIVTLNQTVTRCRRCERLVGHCRQVAKRKTRRYRDERYWGKPVPNFLPADEEAAGGARILIVGLAPGAHGANRTGRMFTGDRSGDFLFDAMHRAGLCNQPASVGVGDGLELIDTVVTAACHCAPPDNRPTPQELNACSGYLDRTFACLPKLRVVVSLGGLAHRAVLKAQQRLGVVDKLSRYPFGHGSAYEVDGSPDLLCSYHPSQQNTFTGRLTPTMLIGVLAEAKRRAGRNG